MAHVKQLAENKVISIILVLTLIATIFLALSAPAHAASNDGVLWSDSGNYTANWMGLTGVWATDSALYNSTNDFYISNAEDLAAFMRVMQGTTLTGSSVGGGTAASTNFNFSGKMVSLTADIDLSAHLWDMRAGWRGGASSGNAFRGTFDGAGHTISGMVIDYDNNYIGSTSDFGGFGLFSDLYKATIKNLTVRNSHINLGKYIESSDLGVGIVAGRSSGSTFNRVNVENAKITQQSDNGRGATVGYTFFGGLVGDHISFWTLNTPTNLPSTYTDCHVDGFEIEYTVSLNKLPSWSILLGFGGIFGGEHTFNTADRINSFQTTITGCTVNNFSVKRGANVPASFCYEVYGGVIGYVDEPIIISDTHVTNLSIDVRNAPTSNLTNSGVPILASSIVGGLVGYMEIGTWGSVPKNMQGVYAIQSSSVQGEILATANPSLKPVYAGGLVGYSAGGIDYLGGSISIYDNYTEMDFTNLLTNKNDKLLYGNLFGYLANGVNVSGNIFNNFDNNPFGAQINDPSAGYLDESLSTFALCGEREAGSTDDLSQNWGILKNILTVGEKEYPLDYVQCTEEKSVVDFYDYYKVNSYTHNYLTQDSDKEQVTFSQDSGVNMFPVAVSVDTLASATTWTFIKDIIVLPAGGATYAVIYDANGGTGTLVDASSPYAVGANVTELANSFAKPGLVFSGWNTAADGSGIAYLPNDTFSMPANSVVLYAQWVTPPPMPTPASSIWSLVALALLALAGAGAVSARRKTLQG